jgi:hypothetical protein
MTAFQCTDPLIGGILSGWRYDISGLSPAMRTDYDQHLSDCAHCRRRQHLARTIDVLLISATSLSILAFLLAAVVLHRIEAIAHLGNSLHGHLRTTPPSPSRSKRSPSPALSGLHSALGLVSHRDPHPRPLLRRRLQQRIPPAHPRTHHEERRLAQTGLPRCPFTFERKRGVLSPIPLPDGLSFH